MYKLQDIASSVFEASGKMDGFTDDVSVLVPALLAAEDHRGLRHLGTDWISVARALLLFPFRRRICAISTVEQQLVRVLIPRKKRDALTKVKEILLAERIARHFPKLIIYKAYLAKAFYGSGLEGYASVKRLVFFNSNLTIDDACKAVALLKYPRPLNPSQHWNDRHRARCVYVRSRMTKIPGFAYLG